MRVKGEKKEVVVKTAYYIEIETEHVYHDDVLYEVN